MSRPKREHQPDRFVRETTRLCTRGRDACDCPCHWWPHVREAARCCGSADMRYITTEDAYIPWPDRSQP
jgi:hypothetical protein